MNVKMVVTRQSFAVGGGDKQVLQSEKQKQICLCLTEVFATLLGQAFTSKDEDFPHKSKNVHLQLLRIWNLAHVMSQKALVPLLHE